MTSSSTPKDNSDDDEAEDDDDVDDDPNDLKGSSEKNELIRSEEVVEETEE